MTEQLSNKKLEDIAITKIYLKEIQASVLIPFIATGEGLQFCEWLASPEQCESGGSFRFCLQKIFSSPPHSSIGSVHVFLTHCKNKALRTRFFQDLLTIRGGRDLSNFTDLVCKLIKQAGSENVSEADISLLKDFSQEAGNVSSDRELERLKEQRESDFPYRLTRLFRHWPDSEAASRTNSTNQSAHTRKDLFEALFKAKRIELVAKCWDRLLTVCPAFKDNVKELKTIASFSARTLTSFHQLVCDLDPEIWQVPMFLDTLVENYKASLTGFNSREPLAPMNSEEQSGNPYNNVAPAYCRTVEEDPASSQTNTVAARLFKKMVTEGIPNNFLEAFRTKKITQNNPVDSSGTTQSFSAHYLKQSAFMIGITGILRVFRSVANFSRTFADVMYQGFVKPVLGILGLALLVGGVVGGLFGGIVGSFIPGVGTLVGAGMGALFVSSGAVVLCVSTLLIVALVVAVSRGLVSAFNRAKEGFVRSLKEDFSTNPVVTYLLQQYAKNKRPEQTKGATRRSIYQVKHEPVVANHEAGLDSESLINYRLTSRSNVNGTGTTDSSDRPVTRSEIAARYRKMLAGLFEPGRARNQHFGPGQRIALLSETQAFVEAKILRKTAKLRALLIQDRQEVPSYQRLHSPQEEAPPPGYTRLLSVSPERSEVAPFKLASSKYLITIAKNRSHNNIATSASSANRIFSSLKYATFWSKPEDADSIKQVNEIKRQAGKLEQVLKVREELRRLPVLS